MTPRPDIQPLRISRVFPTLAPVLALGLASVLALGLAAMPLLACGDDDQVPADARPGSAADSGPAGTPDGAAGPMPDGAAGPTPDGAAGPPGDCTGLLVCDDFESADSVPDPAVWTIESPNCSGSGQIAIDTAVAHSGSRSVRVDGGGTYCDHVFLATDAIAALVDTPEIGGVVHGRFFVRFDQALGNGHVTFATLRDSVENKDLRMGGQSGILMWNRESDDATLPELSPTGIAASVPPVPGQWHCVELAVDGAAGTITTWVDGALIGGLVVDGTPTPDIDTQWLRQDDWRPALVDAKLGWESYGGETNTLWFDDVAFAGARIGCGG